MSLGFPSIASNLLAIDRISPDSLRLAFVGGNVIGGMGIPAINFPNPPLLHKQMNDGIGLIK